MIDGVPALRLRSSADRGRRSAARSLNVGSAIRVRPRYRVPPRIRDRDVGRPALLAEAEAVRVTAMVGAAEDEYRVGVTQRVDLRSDVDGQTCRRCGDQQ
jgi:hypothetical protein